MKSYVITIVDNDKSVKVAERCVQSAKKHGIDVEIFPAFTPDKDPIAYAKKKGIPLKNFEEKYSRFENCVSAFLSHYSLWKKCIEEQETFLIFEHDAVVVNNIPVFVTFKHLMNLGAPSYGKARTPMKIGVNSLTSKAYLPGAHAYMLKPSGAKMLIDKAKTEAGPTDVFIHKARFPWLEEYYPWPAEARDSFTTIQKVEGCLAKHSYGDNYEIL